MFSAAIQRTPFVTAAADRYFGGKIAGDRYGDDHTAVSTLRALLYHRIGNNTLYFEYMTTSYDLSRIGRRTESDWGDAFRTRFEGRDNYLTVMELCNPSKEANEKLFDILAGNFADHDGWVRLKPITDFFRRNFDVLCFIRPAMKQTVYVIKSADSLDKKLRIFHQLQLSFLTALPWYFNPQNGDRLLPEEKELLESLQGRDHTQYLECLKKLEASLDFEAGYIREQLTQIESAYERARLQVVRQEISRTMENIAEYERYINNLLEEITKKNIELSGLEYKLNNSNPESTLCDYFLCNRALRLGIVSGTHMQYSVNTLMTYFDEDQALALIRNPRSVMYFTSSAFPAEHVKKLMTAIFIDEKIRVRFCAAYDLNVSGGVSGVKHYNFMEDELDRMPNPHIQYHACLGDHRIALDAAMRERDYIGAISQTIASASSLNVTDSVVMDEFCRNMFNDKTTRWFELPDGTKMNLIEALDYVTKEEKEEAHE